VKQSEPTPSAPTESVAKLRQWEAFLRKAAKSQNLVSEADLPYLWERHILDSLAPLLAAEPLRLAAGGLWLDIGSGAGLPVIPLAICLPHWRFVAIEPRTLRAQHLGLAIKDLGLANLRVLCSKSEALVGFPDLRNQASAVSTRAVGKIPEDAKRAQPFLAAEGTFVTYKHLESVGSIDGYHPLSYVRYRLPTVEEPRSLVLATLNFPGR
jgi:16S rRNA (guanine527-N7)-methyltransferase